MNLSSILVVGFLLGMKHATEADHLAAVATLATRQTSLAQALRQGLAWGLGHTCTLMLIGGVVLALGKAVPRGMELALECGVGLMLIALGADVLRRLVQGKLHFHSHSHGPGGARHLHLHAHDFGHAAMPVAATPMTASATPQFAKLRFSAQEAQPLHAHAEKQPSGLPLRALAIGMMHGMAGSAALIVLSLQAVQSVGMGLLYILLFGIGSMAGMALLSVVIAVPLRLSAGHLVSLHRGMTALVGAFSVGLGAWVIYRVAVMTSA